MKPHFLRVMNASQNPKSQCNPTLKFILNLIKKKPQSICQGAFFFYRRSDKSFHYSRSPNFSLVISKLKLGFHYKKIIILVPTAPAWETSFRSEAEIMHTTTLQRQVEITFKRIISFIRCDAGASRYAFPTKTLGTRKSVFYENLRRGMINDTIFSDGTIG